MARTFYALVSCRKNAREVYNCGVVVTNTMHFFIESLKHWKTIGAFAACSSAVARKMTKPIDFSRASLLVELGGGTGAITREILSCMRPDARLIVFEINASFAETLRRIGDPRLVVVNDSATELGSYLREQGIRKVDHVISTLPLGTMSRVVRARILTEVLAVLDPDGRYVQIQYSLLSRQQIKEAFPRVQLDFTPFNFPPAFFYICER